MFPCRAPLTLDTEVVLETGIAPLKGKQLQSRIERSTRLKMQVESLPTASAASGSQSNASSLSTLHLLSLGNVVFQLEGYDFNDMQTLLEQKMFEIKKRNQEWDLSLRSDESTALGSSSAFSPWLTRTRQSFTWNQRQGVLRKFILDAFQADATGTIVSGKLPQLTLVTGNAGTGKSEVLMATCGDLEADGTGIFKTTFNNINAIHIKGHTCASAFPFHNAKNCSSTVYELRPHELANFVKITGIMPQAKGGTQLIFLMRSPILLHSILRISVMPVSKRREISTSILGASTSYSPGTCFSWDLSERGYL